MGVTEKEILEELRGLAPSRWVEVQDFIAYLKQRLAKESAQKDHTQIMTGLDLYNLALVGLWADRQDIGDSLEFARKLRYEAEHQWRTPDAA